LVELEGGQMRGGQGVHNSAFSPRTDKERESPGESITFATKNPDHRKKKEYRLNPIAHETQVPGKRKRG